MNEKKRVLEAEAVGYSMEISGDERSRLMPRDPGPQSIAKKLREKFGPPPPPRPPPGERCRHCELNIPFSEGSLDKHQKGSGRLVLCMKSAAVRRRAEIAQKEMADTAAVVPPAASIEPKLRGRPKRNPVTLTKTKADALGRAYVDVTMLKSLLKLRRNIAIYIDQDRPDTDFDIEAYGRDYIGDEEHGSGEPLGSGNTLHEALLNALQRATVTPEVWEKI